MFFEETKVLTTETSYWATVPNESQHRCHTKDSSANILIQLTQMWFSIKRQSQDQEDLRQSWWHTFNSNTQDTEAGGSVCESWEQVPGLLELHNETLVSKKKKRKKIWLSIKAVQFKKKKLQINYFSVLIHSKHFISHALSVCVVRVACAHVELESQHPGFLIALPSSF